MMSHRFVTIQDQDALNDFDGIDSLFGGCDLEERIEGKGGGTDFMPGSD